jgi:hypothetical protein
MKYWEIIVDKLNKAGWTWGYCSAVTQHRWRWIVDAYRRDGRRYIVESDELLTAFLELEGIANGSCISKFLNRYIGTRGSRAASGK